jgi:hypothetical protein
MFGHRQRTVIAPAGNCSAREGLDTVAGVRLCTGQVFIRTGGTGAPGRAGRSPGARTVFIKSD